LPALHDFKWFAKAGGLISGEHVPSGRFNAGEKVWFWIGALVLGIIVSASGLVLNFPNFDQVRAVMIEANLVHAIAAIVFMAMSFGAHLPRHESAWKARTNRCATGYVDETWAKEHHEHWYNDVKSGKIKAGTAAGAASRRRLSIERRKRQ